MITLDKPASPVFMPKIPGPCFPKGPLPVSPPACPDQSRKPCDTLETITLPGKQARIADLFGDSLQPMDLNRRCDPARLRDLCHDMERYLDGVAVDTFIAIPGSQERHAKKMDALLGEISCKLGKLSHSERAELAGRLVDAQKAEASLPFRRSHHEHLRQSGYASLLDAVFSSARH